VTLLRLLLLVTLFLAVTAAAAGWFVFVPRLPAPTGPHAVVREEATIQDSAGRPVAIEIWRPRDLEASARDSSPLVLYSPGWGGTRRQSEVQVANLASHGFVVVGCDDIANDSANDPEHGLALELTTDADTAASIARAGRHAVLQGKRLHDVLAALGAGQVTPLAGRLDLSHVGVLGYSIGGAAGLAAAATDPRIIAVFNIDGGLFGPAPDGIAVDNYFLLSSVEAFPTAQELASSDPFTRNYARISAMDIPRNTQRMAQPRGYWAQIPTAGHGDLSDGLFARSGWPLAGWRSGRTNFQRAAVSRTIGDLEVAFFRSALLNDSGPLQSLLGRDDQIVRWISPTSPSAGAAKARQ
jgi:dienelactone hydrolase